MGQTDLKPTAQGQVESSINDTINFIMAKVAAGEIDAATETELIAAARKDYESNVPVTTSAQQAVQLQQTANPYQADPQTAYAVPEMEPEQTPIDYGQFATSTNYPHTYDVEDSSDVDMDALSGIASDVFDKQPRKKLSRKERKARAKEMKKLQKESRSSSTNLSSRATVCLSPAVRVFRFAVNSRPVTCSMTSSRRTRMRLPTRSACRNLQHAKNPALNKIS